MYFRMQVPHWNKPDSGAPEPASDRLWALVLMVSLGFRVWSDRVGSGGSRQTRVVGEEVWMWRRLSSWRLPAESSAGSTQVWFGMWGGSAGFLTSFPIGPITWGKLPCVVSPKEDAGRTGDECRTTRIKSRKRLWSEEFEGSGTKTSVSNQDRTITNSPASYVGTPESLHETTAVETAELEERVLGAGSTGISATRVPHIPKVAVIAD